MDKEEILQIITAFVISLVINLPIAYAQLTNPKVYGEDMIEGYVRNETELFNFGVNAKIDNKTINPKQIRLWGTNNNTGFGFTSCNLSTNGYYCYLEDLNLYEQGVKICPIYTHNINLYSAGILYDTKQVTHFCDNTKPVISKFETDKGMYNNNEMVNFIFTILDKADISDKCVGIRKAVLEVGEYNKNIEINTNPGQCSYTGSVSSEANLFSEGENKAKLTAYDNFGLNVSKSITFSTDFSGPEIKTIEITKADGSEIGYYIFNQQIYVNINVNFTENTGIDAKYAILKSNDLGIVNSKANYCTKYQCFWDNKRAIMKKPNVVITVSLRDVAGNNNSEDMSYSFAEDKVSPVVKNLKVTDRQNNDITSWISGNSLQAYVYVDISDNDALDMNGIKADLSELNTLKNYKNINPSSCSKEINGTRCRWDIEIKLNQSKSVSLIFKASDRSKNNVSESFTYNLKVDNEGPVAKDIKTDIIYNGIYYVKEIGSTITVEFTETGVGLGEAFLDLTDLGAGIKKADECINNVCYWKNIAISTRDGTYKVKVSPETKDKLGNKLQNSLEIDVIVDITPPVVKSVKVEPVAGSNPLIEGYIQTGNALVITATVYEPIALTASGDFSKFIKDAKSVPTVCYVENSTWTCAWETSEIDMLGYIVGYLRFNFTDFIGNTEIFEQPLIVLAAENETKDYWRNNVLDPSPEGIDKELIALYDPFIWFPVNLEAKGKSSIWPLSVEVGECLNFENESYGAYISSEFGNKPELFNYNDAKQGNLPYKIYLKYTLERAEPPKDNLPITCTLNIRTLVEKQRISQIETENITVEIPYYYNPLGTLDESIKAEIDRVSDSWLVKGKWIDTFNDIFKYAKMICRFVNSLYDIVLIFAYIKSVLSGTCALTAGLGCAEAKLFGEQVEYSKNVLYRTYETFGHKWCRLLSCQMWPKVGEQSKADNWILGRMREAYSREGYWGNVDPQHSLILSAIYLCLPGVFYNLQKARVIDCQYVNCLKEAEVGMPIQYCTSQRSYGYCKFIYGEFFNLIPFASAISYLSQNVRRALSHPLEAIGFAISIPCRLMCTSATPVGIGCFPCTVVENFNLLLEVLCDLGVGKGCEPVWDELKVDDNVCEGISEEEESEEGGSPEV